MNIVQIVAGIAAGTVGAAVWAAVAFFAGINAVVIAWGIGAIVGFAIAKTGRTGGLPGVAAVLITIVAIMAGKYGTFEIAMHKVRQINQEVLAGVDGSDEAVLLAGVHKRARERVDAGDELVWPDGMTIDDAETQEDYPQELWEEVEQEWKAKSDAEREALRQQHVEDVKESLKMLDGLFDGMKNAMFWGSFGLRDLLFFGLAIYTAWATAGRTQAEESDE